MLADLRDGKTSWVVTEDPAVQNVGHVMNVSSRDEPRTDATRTTSRYDTRLL